MNLADVRSGDYAWLVLMWLVSSPYELFADDLLSEATDRYRLAHPVLERLVIIAVAGHLGGMLPGWADVFSAKNLIHRGIVAATHADRSKKGEQSPSQIPRAA